MSKHPEVIYQTREGVFYLIPNTDLSYVKHEVFFSYTVFKKQIPRLEKSEA